MQEKFIYFNSLIGIIMSTQSKKGQNKLIIALDVVGFVLIGVGAALIRFAKDDIISILGGFVMGGGITILSITRLIKK